MTMSQNETSLKLGPTGQRPSTAPALSTAALDNLAARFRPAGFCLVMLRADGSVVYHDAAAAPFFHRFVIPQMQNPEASGFQKILTGLNASSPVTFSGLLPGLV